MHEQSETIQDPKTKKWVNVYGKKTNRAGQRLPGSGEHATVEEAVKEAAARSEAYGKSEESFARGFSKGPHRSKGY